MSLQNWHLIAAQARQRHQSNSPSRDWQQPQLARKILLITAVLFLLVATAYPFSNGYTSQSTISASTNRVISAAASTGVVYLNPGSVTLQYIGISLTVQIKVSNMPQFNGWDVRILTGQAPLTINATDVSISGNIFAANASGGSPFEIVHCVNGAGTGCTSSDGPGVVHSAFGDTAFTSGNGLLFSVTYKVVSSSRYAPITIQNSLISSSSPTGVPHSDQNGFYGIIPIGGSGGGGKSLAD